MKTIEDVKLEMKVSDMILDLIDDVTVELVSMPRGDYQGVVEAVAMQIVETVKKEA